MDLLAVDRKLHVERNVLPEHLSLNEPHLDTEKAYPVVVEVRHLQNGRLASSQNNIGHPRSHLEIESEEDAVTYEEHANGDRNITEKINAKYLLACDGAHSWTRRQLRLPMEGEQTDYVWGVMDIIPLTNFPDIRQACAIHSATAGSILNVPREDRLNRLYIQLGLEDNSSTRAQVTHRTMIKAAQKIMAPYTIDYKHCDWWSLYKVGQRISPKFSAEDRIFLAGDAVHTHSPKLGQGMNVSMQDAYNIGWKLGAVISGSAKLDVLATYEAERRQVALDLLDADREIARFYARNPRQRPLVLKNSTEADIPDFGRIREKMHDFLAGVGITYAPSILVAKAAIEHPDTNLTNGHSNVHNPLLAKRSLAKNIKLGACMPSHKILNQASARPVQLATMLKSDGRWRVLVFAGDITFPTQAARIKTLGTALAGPDSLLHKYTPSQQPIDSLIEVLTIHSSPRTEVDIFDFPDIFHPYHEDLGWDYSKIFVDDVAYHEEDCGVAYAKYGISREEGCLVVCRPDQHVGYIGALEDVGDVQRYFEGILIPQA